ncbi:hypothetical protein RI367_001263 [Sorochytrium milnesiophthora]
MVNADSSKVSIDTNEKALALDPELGDGAPPVATPPRLCNAALKYKIAALTCAMLISFGSAFFGTSYGTMKKPLIKNMHISNTQYGTSQAADNLLNSVLPLVAAAVFDYYGTGVGSIAVTLAILVGNIMVGLATTSNSFALLVAGRMMYGLGAGSANLIQQVIAAHWFEGAQLGKALAAIITMNRIAQAIGTATVVPASVGRHYGFGVWIAAGVAGMSVLANVVYIVLLRSVQRSMGINHGSTVLKKRGALSVRSILFMSHTFWLIVFINWIAAGVMTSFLGFATDLLAQRDHSTDSNTAYKTTLSLVVTIILNPVFGHLIDRVGQRVTISAVSMVLLSLFIGLMGFTHVDSYVLMGVLAASIALKGIAQLSAIPILVPFRHTATAFAIFRCSSSISTSILDNVVGVVQDDTPGRGYNRVMALMLVLSLLATAANFVWSYSDWRFYGGLMQQNDRRRKAYMDEKRAREEEDEASGKVPHAGEKLGLWNKVYGAVFFASVVAAFVIFIYLVAAGRSEPAS